MNHYSVAMCAGLLIVVLGTFLPWLVSGSVDRNSYAADGLMRNLLNLHGAADGLSSAWPFLALLCALAAAVLLFGLSALGAGVAVVPAFAGAAVAVAALVRGSSGVLHPALAGPLVTLLGAAVVLIAVVSSLVAHASRRRSLRRNR